MTDPAYTADERIVVGAIMAAGPGAPISAKTVPAIAARSGMGIADVEATLRKLMQDFAPPVVHHDVDAVTGEEFWIALDEADEKLHPPAS